MVRKRITQEEYLAAGEAGRLAAETEPRARSAHYDPTSKRVVIELTNGCVFAFPAEYGQGLRGATAEQLSNVEVVPGGSGLVWDEIDAGLSVPGLVAGVFGSAAWMRELGRLGGQVQSPAKAAASRENGKKGGRPRKVRPEPSPAPDEGTRHEPARRRVA